MGRYVHLGESRSCRHEGDASHVRCSDHAPKIGQVARDVLEAVREVRLHVDIIEWSVGGDRELDGHVEGLPDPAFHRGCAWEIDEEGDAEGERLFGGSPKDVRRGRRRCDLRRRGHLRRRGGRAIDAADGREDDRGKHRTPEAQRIHRSRESGGEAMKVPVTREDRSCVECISPSRLLPLDPAGSPRRSGLSTSTPPFGRGPRPSIRPDPRTWRRRSEPASCRKLVRVAPTRPDRLRRSGLSTSIPPMGRSRSRSVRPAGGRRVGPARRPPCRA